MIWLRQKQSRIHNFHKKELGKGGGGVEGEVTNGGKGGVWLRWKFMTTSCLYSRYIYKSMNITRSCIYKCFRGLYPTAWLTLQNTGSIQGSEILKACILFGEKRCSGSNSKVCYCLTVIVIFVYFTIMYFFV